MGAVADAAPFARFFEGAHEGFYIGTLDEAASTTFAANAHLKLILGYPPELPDEQVRAFDPPRFVDPEARASLLGRLRNNVETALRKKLMTIEESRTLINRFRQGMIGYTYLDRE